MHHPIVPNKYYKTCLSVSEQLLFEIEQKSCGIMAITGFYILMYMTVYVLLMNFGPGFDINRWSPNCIAGETAWNLLNTDPKTIAIKKRQK